MPAFLVQQFDLNILSTSGVSCSYTLLQHIAALKLRFRLQIVAHLHMSVLLLKKLLDGFGSLRSVNRRLGPGIIIIVLTSMKVSKSLSKLARFSFRFLLSAIKLAFCLSSSCRCCSSASRSECSWLIRANITVFSSSLAASGCCSRKSSTEINGNR